LNSFLVCPVTQIFGLALKGKVSSFIGGIELEELKSREKSCLSFLKVEKLSFIDGDIFFQNVVSVNFFF